MKRSFLEILIDAKSQNQKLLAILVDPDKTKELDRMTVLAAEKKVDVLLVGGSLISNGSMDETIHLVEGNFENIKITNPYDLKFAELYL